MSSAASVLLVLRFPSFTERSLRVFGLFAYNSSIFLSAQLASSIACFKPWELAHPPYLPLYIRFRIFELLDVLWADVLKGAVAKELDLVRLPLILGIGHYL